MYYLRSRLLLVLAGLFVPSAAFACTWDYDTLLQERSRFPDTLELITGKFLRHSQEFYEWRIQDRLQKLQHDPENLGYLDDLAVAYDKTGKHQLAIETMQASDRKKAGRYETLANLGTFYVHSGQLKKGLPYIDQAIRINANAHFGREKYQKQLVQYVLSRRQNGALVLPLATWGERKDGIDEEGFATFLAYKLTNEMRKDAIRGILGMMRFGNHESPILLEALGNLLRQMYDYPDDDAKRLAATAYLKASYSVPDERVKRAYRNTARRVLSFQTKRPGVNVELPLEELEASFKQQLAEAQAWYNTVRQDEQTWIREGKNPEEEFTRKYYSQPSIATTGGEGVGPDQVPAATPGLEFVHEDSETEARLVLVMRGVAAVIVVVVGLLVLLLIRRKRSVRAVKAHPK